jgi:glc operon protein GlcG
MRRVVLAITIVAVTAGFTTTASVAQNPPQGLPTGQTPQGEGGRPQAGPPQTMDLATAKKMVAAAEAAASAVNKNVAICVMDTNGDVVLAERMDNTEHNPVITAQGKARAVLMFGIPTGEIAQAIRDKKPISAAVRNLPTGYGGEYTLARGGLPIMRDGKMIGAIGVGGASDDEKFSQAGVDVISTK